MADRKEAVAVIQARADGGLSLHCIYGDGEEIYI